MRQPGQTAPSGEEPQRATGASAYPQQEHLTHTPAMSMRTERGVFPVWSRTSAAIPSIEEMIVSATNLELLWLKFMSSTYPELGAVVKKYFCPARSVR